MLDCVDYYGIDVGVVVVIVVVGWLFIDVICWNFVVVVWIWYVVDFVFWYFYLFCYWWVVVVDGCVDWFVWCVGGIMFVERDWKILGFFLF